MGHNWDSDQPWGSLEEIPGIDDGDTFIRSDFTLLIKLHVDEDGLGAMGYPGTFSNHQADGCVERENPGRGEYKYFHPCNPASVHIEAGATPEEARRYVREDLERAESYGSAWHYMIVQVLAFQAGIELGSASLGQVESDSEQDHLKEIIDGLADEAIKEAQASLENLCSCD